MGYTPGPWFSEMYEGVIGDISDADGNSVAQAQARLPLASGRPDEERKANTRLIAAAPDLLEALKHARDQIRHPDQMIDEAISKAEGKS